MDIDAPNAGKGTIAIDELAGIMSNFKATPDIEWFYKLNKTLEKAHIISEKAENASEIYDAIDEIKGEVDGVYEGFTKPGNVIYNERVGIKTEVENKDGDAHLSEKPATDTFHIKGKN